MTELWARRARPDEAGVIVEIFREAFSPWLIERSIYGCTGAERYVTATSRRWPVAAPTFMVAGASSSVLAAAELSFSGGHEVFLSYIATRKGVRSSGLGTRLLSAVVKFAEGADAHTLALDVFDSNERARSWYASLEFESLGERGWWEFDLPQARGPLAPVLGLAQGDVCHRAFGFSEFTVRIPEGDYRIGRLGSRWYRLPDPAVMTVPSIVATLATLDPRRRGIAVGDMDGVAKTLFNPPVARSFRLYASIQRLRVSLVGQP